jgi:hypothetical protein
VREKCFSIENEYNELMKNPPNNLNDAIQMMKDINTENSCKYVRKDNYTVIEKCNVFMNGLMKLGISNVIDYLY